MLGVVPVTAGGLALTRLRGPALVSYAVRSARALTPDVAVVIDSLDAGLLRVLDEEPAVEVRALDDPASVARLARDCADAQQVVLHDPRCPLLPVAELRRVAGSGAAAAVGVRPVTDTVKTLRPGAEVDFIAATVDRDDYRAVCSPLALSAPATVILDRELGPAWWTVDPWVLVAALRRYVDVELVDVSSLGRRVEDEDAVRLLACLEDVSATT